jgi:hypothetical protein
MPDDQQQPFQPLPLQPIAPPGALPFAARYPNVAAMFQSMQPPPMGQLPSVGQQFSPQGWYTPQRQADIYGRLTSGGIAPEGARGLMSHMMNVESRDLGPSTFNPSGGGRGAMGMGQWRGPRQAGVTLGDAPGQTQHILNELSSPYFKGPAGVLKNPAATTPQAARASEQFFEGSGVKRLNPAFLNRTQAGMGSIARPMPLPPSMPMNMSPPPIQMSMPPPAIGKGG